MGLFVAGIQQLLSITHLFLALWFLNMQSFLFCCSWFLGEPCYLCPRAFLLIFSLFWLVIGAFFPIYTFLSLVGFEIWIDECVSVRHVGKYFLVGFRLHEIQKTKRQRSCNWRLDKIINPLVSYLQSQVLFWQWFELCGADSINSFVLLRKFQIEVLQPLPGSSAALSCVVLVRIFNRKAQSFKGEQFAFLCVEGSLRWSNCSLMRVKALALACEMWRILYGYEQDYCLV